jgi:hypothetical protein
MVESLDVKQIRKWARTHHDLTGKWPGRDSGEVFGQSGVTWSLIDRCLKRGGYGLPGNSSLSRALRGGGAVIRSGPPKRELTTKQILEWADLHHMRSGEWPHRESGRVREAPDTTWGTIDRRMRRGEHNGGRHETLTHLLRDQRGVWDSRGSVRLTPKLILRLADQHYARTGRWPVTLSGPVHGIPGEKWVNIDMAMRNGRRGFGRKMSLSQLLTQERGASYNPQLNPLSIRHILDWSLAYHRRTGRWPTRKSGDVYGAPGETWSAIDFRLNKGGRGLPGGSSLAQLLDKHFSD